MTMTTVIGIDPSFTSTGMCVLCRYNEPETDAVITEILATEAIVTTPTGKNSAAADCVRAEIIAKRLLELIEEHNPQAIILEAPAFSSNGNATRSLAILFGYIQGALSVRFKGTVECITPSALKKFATGQGNAPKQALAETLEADEPFHYFHIAQHPKSKGRADIIDAYWLGRYLLK